MDDKLAGDSFIRKIILHAQHIFDFVITFALEISQIRQSLSILLCLCKLCFKITTYSNRYFFKWHGA